MFENDPFNKQTTHPHGIQGIKKKQKNKKKLICVRHSFSGIRSCLSVNTYTYRSVQGRREKV